MDSNQPKGRDPIPEYFNTIEELGEFWDTHSTADYEDLMEPVEFEVDLSSSRIYFPVQKDLYRLLREQARKQGVSTETLANLWLQEKLVQQTTPAANQLQPAGSPA